MKKFLQILIRHWSKSPGKIALTIFSLALGTGILTLSFTTTRYIDENINRVLEAQGSILMVSNATRSSTGIIEAVRPGQWDLDALTALESDSRSIEVTSPVTTLPYREFTALDGTWQVRRAVGTDPAYFDIFGLEMVAGLAMTEGDLSAADRRVWVSESLATRIWGSAEAAVGQTMQPPAMVFRAGPGGREGSAQTRTVTLLFTVTGVYNDPAEVLRKAYGVADLVMPYTNALPTGGNANQASFLRNMLAATFVSRSRTTNLAQAEADIRETLSSTYGNELDMVIWEGSPEGSSDYLANLRQTVSLFSVSINILGLMLLVISSLGIFSVMVIESLGRKREIALERALGASQGRVLQEFWSWSVSLSLLGGVLGILLALVSSGAVMRSLAPLLVDFSNETGLLGPGIDPLAGLLALGLTLVFGGFLGLLPGISAVRGGIADTIREV